MSGEDERKPYDLQPKTSAEILGEVGLTPEDLHGKKVLFFGNGQSGLTVEGADVRTGDPEVFDMLEDEDGNPIIVPIVELGSFDLILGNDSGDLNTDFTNGYSIEFFLAALAALRDGGQIRVPTIEWVHTGREERAERERDYDMLSFDRGFVTATSILASEAKEQAYFIILKKGKV
jgi:hypothetical protein